jgi:glycosyltransferase involved in cell wall biosynthesis
MKILVISQQYWPESWRIIGTCEELVNRGHDVTVVCGLPNDSEGRLVKAYHRKAMRCQEHNGVHIFRVSDHPRWRGDLNLYLKYVSFSKRASRLIHHFNDDFDVVFVNQLSPIMQAIPAIRYSENYHCPIVMYCQDLWPESLSVRGINNHGFTKPIYSHYLRLSKKIYNRMDHILVTSPAYQEYLSHICDVPTKKLECLEQYAEPFFFGTFQPDLHQSSQHNFVFAGNIGQAQDTGAILKAAELLKNHPGIRIHLVGDGSGLKKMKKLANSYQLNNVVFHRRVPAEEMPGVYQGADGLLITLSHDSFTSYVLPAKLTSYLASGKPVIGACNGAVADLIREAQCGVCVPSGDFRGLAREILRFSQLSEEEKEKLGSNGRVYAAAHFSYESYFDRLEKVLKDFCKK